MGTVGRARFTIPNAVAVSALSFAARVPARSKSKDAPARFAKNKDSRIGPGGHGYLPEHPDMGATFVAAGPAFKQGARLPRFSNLEVYPALAKVLGLELLRPIDGKLDVLNQALAEQ